MRTCIAILSWNAADKLEVAAQSALAQTAADVDVLVVDNASTDATEEVLMRLEATGCRIVRNPSNLGYARGMNVAFENAGDADAFVALNCDAQLDAEFVTRAAALLESRPRVGALGALVRRTHAHPGQGGYPATAQRTLDGFVIALRTSMRTRLIDQAEGVVTTFKPNGACPVLRRQAIEDVRATYGTGPFDPVFDTYGEDIDLAFKMWAIGWETVASDSLLAIHERSYGDRSRIFDRRGRLRVNSVAARYLNAARHLPSAMLVPTKPRLVLEDVALIVRQLTVGDRMVVADVRAAWARIRRLRSELRRFRREHPPLSTRAVWDVMNCRGLARRGASSAH